MYYVIVKVITASDYDNCKIEIMSICHCYSEVDRFMDNMIHIVINNRKIALHKFENKPNDQDPDGYFIVQNKEDKMRYDIYHKKVTLNKGYVYDSASLEIYKPIFFQIVQYSDYESNNKIHYAKINYKSFIYQY